MKTFSTFVVEAKDPNEYDKEGEMAENQLRTIIDAAEDLIDLLEDDDNLPEWAQNKITKAVDYLDSVRDYMVSDAEGEEDDDEEDNLEEATGKLNAKGEIEMTAKNYAKVHKDYKTKMQGVPYAMQIDPKTGGTALFPVKIIKESVELDEAFSAEFDK